MRCPALGLLFYFLILAPAVSSAQDLEVLHWWTSGGEAQSFAVFKRAHQMASNDEVAKAVSVVVEAYVNSNMGADETTKHLAIAVREAVM
jgi:hypothetical protein